MKPGRRATLQRQQLQAMLGQTAAQLSSRLESFLGVRPENLVVRPDGKGSLIATSRLPTWSMEQFFLRDTPEGRKAITGRLYSFPHLSVADIARETRFIVCPSGDRGSNMPWASKFIVSSVPGKSPEIVRQEILVGVRCCGPSKSGPLPEPVRIYKDWQIVEILDYKW
jgi:hypothetical protein